MCTVSVIPLAEGGFRLVSNRDEARTRPSAEAPTWRQLARGGRAIWPRDPAAGGTWIAAGEDGLAVTVLNGNLEPPPDLAGLELTSRGLLVPEVIESRDAPAAIAVLRRMELGSFAPFRLVVADAADGTARVLDAFWDRIELQVTEHGAGPICFASSGLGDSRVRPRLPLFERMVAVEPTPAAQDAFHEHFWSEDLPISVWMAREEARTVSITSASVTPTRSPAAPAPCRIEFDHRPVGEPTPPGRRG